MVKFFRKGLIDAFYTGKGAERYEAGRRRSDKWRFEEQAFETLFSNLPDPEVEVVADMPVGTNRFGELFEARGAVKRVYCVDLSIDMLAQALQRQAPKQVFIRHDVLAGPPNFSCGSVISFRFLNLFPFSDVQNIMKNLSQVAKNNMIFSVRLASGSSCHGDVLAGKVYIHGEDEFRNLVSEVGFSVKQNLYHPDDKGGRYFVMLAARNA